MLKFLGKLFYNIDTWIHGYIDRENHKIVCDCVLILIINELKSLWEIVNFQLTFWGLENFADSSLKFLIHSIKCLLSLHYKSMFKRKQCLCCRKQQ